MRKMLVFMSVLSLGLLAGAFQSIAKADPDYREEKLTFNEPVEIPGMVLLPGTYDFRYLDAAPMPGVVLIYDSTGKFVKLLLADPAYRTEITGKTEVTFEKREPKAPEAIKEWFYPGQSSGVAFKYPKALALTSGSATSSGEGQ